MSTEPRFRLSMGSSIYARFGPGNLDRESLVKEALETGAPLEDWQARHVAEWYRGSASGTATREPWQEPAGPAPARHPAASHRASHSVTSPASGVQSARVRRGRGEGMDCTGIPGHAGDDEEDER